jgi:hypothetical protein
VTLKFVPTLRPAAQLSALGFAVDRALANEASRSIEALEATRTTERVARIVRRLLELFPAAKIAAAVPRTDGRENEQVREGGGSEQLRNYREIINRHGFLL